MGKIICDVCGTAYSDTASHCPICGCARTPDAKSAVGQENSQGRENAAPVYVKGGRFSRSNVKKSASGRKPPERRPSRERRKEPENNKGLIVVVVLLLVAIMLVVIYIGVRVFLPGRAVPGETTPGITETQPNATKPTVSPVPCTGIKLSNKLIELQKETMRWMLSVEVEPQNTTDPVIYTSSNPNVATVDEKGLILPVAHGETIITVTCGNVSVECTVKCSFGEPGPGTDPSEPSKPDVEIPDGFVLELNRKDFTLRKQGEQWQLFNATGGVSASDITWTVEDPAVATVEDGLVVAVGHGVTTVRAEIGNQTASCTVRCPFKETENEKPTEGNGVSISYEDVTIGVDETFWLRLTKEDSSKINGLEWKASKDGFVTIDGDKITGKKPTGRTPITVSVTYEGVEYKCIVRVKPADK